MGDRRLLGIAEVEAVGEADRLAAGARDVERGAEDGSVPGCEWITLAEPRRLCTTTPGVYLFKQESALVYVGRAGERSGKGLRGRLTIYVSGRAPQSGFGNLALE
jgi:hypothetical protein